MSTLNLWTRSPRFSMRKSATLHSIELSLLSFLMYLSAFYSFVSFLSSFLFKCSYNLSSIPFLTNYSILVGSAMASFPNTLIMFFSLTLGGGGGRRPNFTLSCLSLSLSNLCLLRSFFLSYSVI